jgi:peptidoglycan/LPS O-acetylase OafA/YrhL
MQRDALARGGFRLGHRPALDGLRGLAVLVVMVGHLNLIGSAADLLTPHLPFATLLAGGYFGVDIFFVLSGFLITATLVEEHQATGYIRCKAFYLRRVVRLLPALAVMLGACCVYAACHVEPGKGRFILRGVVLGACYAANFFWCFPGLSLGMLTHLWSLCLEEQFYLLWPLILRKLLTSRLNRRAVAALVALLAAAAALFRFGVWRWGGVTGYHAACVSLPARADALLAGAFVALLVCRGGVPSSPMGRSALRGATWLAAAVLCGLVVSCGPGWHLFVGAYALAGASSALLIAGMVAAPPPLLHALLAFPALTRVGRISYGLYLWHVPVFCTAPLLLHRLPGGSGADRSVLGALCLFLSFLLATLSFYFVERPCQRWLWRSRLIDIERPAGSAASSSNIDSDAACGSSEPLWSPVTGRRSA